MRKINLLGITLVDYTLKESLKIANIYLNNGALNTVSFVTTKILVEAGEQPEQKEWLESMDMTICDETDILRASDSATRNRIREVENGEFLSEFLNRLVWNRKEVFLLADTEKQMNRLKEELEEMQVGLRIVGSYIQDELPGGSSALVNEINDIVPDVIISRFPYPVQEQLMFENKKMVNANLWLALPEHRIVNNHKGIRSLRLPSIFYKKAFKRRVSQYNDDKAE